MACRREDKAACFDADDHVYLNAVVVALQGVDGAFKSLLIFEKRGDVVEKDTGFGEVRNLAYQLFECIQCD